MIKFYVIDMMTNGLSYKNYYHEINEISIIRCEDRVQLTRKIKTYNPERSSYDALKITNKTLQDLNEGLSREEIVNNCNGFFEKDGLESNSRCIICHNINFDRNFLYELWGVVDKIFPADLWLDTISMSREFAKKNNIIKPKFNLNAACDMVGIKKVAGIHNAKSDSRNTFLLWQTLIKEIDYISLIKNKPQIKIVESELIDFDLLNENPDVELE